MAYRTGNAKYPFYVFLGILLACKLFYWWYVYLNPDEAYYWLWGRNPALSYHDHPPLNALIQGLFYQLFGKSLFVVRLPAFIALVISGTILYRMLKKLNYQVDAKLILLTIFSTPLMFIFTSFAWNDCMMIAMGLCANYFWLNYLTCIWNNQPGKSSDILLGAAFLGLAALSKYNAVFIALGLGSLVIGNKKLHFVLKDFRVYGGVVLCLLIISPIFIWNIQNDYGSFQFTLMQRTLTPLLEGEFFRGNFWGFVLGSIFLISPFVFWAMIKLLTSPLQPPNNYADVYGKLAKHIFIWSSGTFLFLSTFSLVLYYWNLAAYLLIFPLAITYLLHQRRKWLLVTLSYAAIINVVVIFHLGIIPFTSLIKGAQYEDRDNVLLYGWDKIGGKIQTLIAEPPNNTQIFTSSYRTAALLSFELDRKDIYSYSPRFDQFTHWTKNIIYHTCEALILTDDWKPMNSELKAILSEFQQLDTIPISKWGYPIKEYYLYRGIIDEEHCMEGES